MHADFALLREWLARPHVKLWWRDPVEHDIAEIKAGIEGRDPSIDARAAKWSCLDAPRATIEKTHTKCVFQVGDRSRNGGLRGS